MPIYEYRCTKCGRITEKIQKVDDPPLDTCEACSGALEKIVSRTSFQLKGGGWFRSGYSSTPSESSGSKESSKSEDTKPSKSDEVKTSAGGKGGCSSGGCGCH